MYYKKETIFIEALNSENLIHLFRRNRAKVMRLKGNSPDRKLRCLILMQLKELKLIYVLRDKLGSSYSLKKA
jgi:hypothetical protein